MVSNDSGFLQVPQVLKPEDVFLSKQKRSRVIRYLSLKVRRQFIDDYRYENII
jgi:hypothetical protein